MPRESTFQRLSRHMHEYFCGTSQSPESLFYEINHCLGRQIGDEPTEEMTDWLESFLSEFSMKYVQGQAHMLHIIFSYWRQWDACLYSNPIAHALYNVQNHIVQTNKWEKWVPYCELVGMLIEPEVQLFEHEDRILRILVQAFDTNYPPHIEHILLVGAATCMSKVEEPVAQYIGSRDWSLGLTRVVTPVDWQRWTAYLEAFAHNESQKERLRELAAEAVQVMRVPYSWG